MLSPSDRTRLVALLGMLGSAHPGERDNAAILIEKFRKERNLTWDILVRAAPSTEFTEAEEAKQAAREAFARGYAHMMAERHVPPAHLGKWPALIVIAIIFGLLATLISLFDSVLSGA